MKKTSKLACMVASGIVLACTMLFSACQKEYSVSKGPEAPELEGIDSVHIAHQLLLEDESEYANGEIRFVCLDSVWAFKGGASYSGTAKCKCVWSVDRRVLRDLPEDTCMEITSTADPSHLIFGSSRTVVTLQSAEMLYANVVVDGIEYSVKNQLFGHKCLISPYRLCTSGDNVTFWGRGDDNDTVSAEGDRGRNVHDTVPIHHYDTVVVERHDTTFIVVHDTTFIVDTVTNDTVRFVVDSVVYSPAHISEANLVFVSNTLRAECANTIATTVYRNGQVHSTTSRNFSGIFDHLYSESGTYLTSHVGQSRAIGANGMVNWGGFSQTFTHQPHYTNPSGYEPWLRYLDCDFVWDSVYGQSNGILVAGHYVCPNGNHRKTYLIPKTPGNPDTTTRRIIGRDTSWNGCGHVYQTWLNASATVLAYYIARTGVETVTYNIGSPLTVTNTVRDTTVYSYTVTVNGQGNPADVNTTANFSGNTVTFGTLSVTLTPYGSQSWCNLTHTTGTLTSTGVNVTGVYNGSSRQTLIPVTFVNPPLFSEEVIMAVASDGYKAATPNVLSGDRVTSLIVIVAKHAGSSTTYWFYHGDWNTFATRADLDSVQITATEATYYSSQLLNDYYPAIVFNHNNPTQFKRGVVKSTYLSASSCWQLIYKIAEPGANHDQVAYTMSASAWTIAGDGGRNALRGVMTSTGSLTADGVTKQIY